MERAPRVNKNDREDKRLGVKLRKANPNARMLVLYLVGFRYNIYLAYKIKSQTVLYRISGTRTPYISIHSSYLLTRRVPTEAYDG